MLDPNRRTLLTAAISPDPGYRLDHALFTSFTLDLTTLMEIPVALTFQEWQARDPESGLSRIAMLDAIRRQVGNLTVVSQAGVMTGPRKGHPLLPLLEPAVHPIVMPPNSTFHPKVTLLRYVADEETLEGGGSEVTYKLICSSRNLSRSRAWDTIVVLDGTLTDRRQSDAKGLDRFVSGVLELAAESPTGLTPERAEAIGRMADEAPRIALSRPLEVKDGKNNLEIVPIGFGGPSRSPEPIRGDQLRLIITPFLGGQPDEVKGDRLLEKFANANTTLVSRQSELDRVPEELLEKFGEVLVLSDLAQEAEDDSANTGSETVTAPDSELRGLHAKLLVEDDGYNCRILIGSPNLSERAFSRNREFALKFTVSRYKHGVEKILGADSKSGLRKYLQDYVRSDAFEESEAEIRAAERSLERVADSLLRGDLGLRISAPSDEESDQQRDVWLEAEKPIGPLPPGITADARPVSLGSDRRQQLQPRSPQVVEWQRVPVPSITSLVAIRLSTTVNGEELSHSFVTKVRLVDPLPEARDRLIIRRLIDSSSQFLNYLSFLLSGSSDPSSVLELVDQLDETEEPEAAPGASESAPQAIALPLMEKLIQAVDRDPEAIDSIASIVKELERDKDGRQILSEAGFASIWEPVMAARLRRNEVRR